MKIFLALPFIFFALQTQAHDGHKHESQQPVLKQTANELPSELPFSLGGDFALTDQFGKLRTNIDGEGRPQLLFFGYANCESICSVAMPTIASATDKLRLHDFDVLPVMITVDPERDTKEIMREKLALIHPDFIGLTGDEMALKKVRDKFAVETTKQFENDHGAIYSHGSFIFVLGGDGKVQTIMPPIVTPERLVEIVLKYNK